MIKIKFSHEYDKLPRTWKQQETWIVHASEVDLEKLPKDFLYYDTAYTEHGLTGHYDLPKKGKFILLLLFQPPRGLFTTLRRWTTEKWKYYKALENTKTWLE